MYFSQVEKDWKNYHGSQKRPFDFDQFWQQGMDEVDLLGTDFQLVKKEDFHSTQVEASHLWFTGVEGGKIHAQFFQPKNSTKKELPVLFLFHGYHTSAGDWADKIGFGAEQMIVVALDVRGQGGLSEDFSADGGGDLKGHIIRGVQQGPKHLFFRRVFLDIYQLTQIVQQMPNVDSQQFYAYGASQGGALALICAALHPKIKHTFCLYPFLSDYRKAFSLDVNQSAYEELAYWFKFRDPLHQQEEKFFSTLDYIDLQYFASRILGKVSWGIGLEDQICPAPTQFAVYNQLTCEKEMLAFPEYGHEYLPLYSDFMHEQLYLDLNKEEVK